MGTTRLIMCSPCQCISELAQLVHLRQDMRTGSSFCSGSGSFSPRLTLIVTRFMLAPVILSTINIGQPVHRAPTESLPRVLDQHARDFFDYSIPFSSLSATVARFFVELSQGRGPC